MESAFPQHELEHLPCILFGNAADVIAIGIHKRYVNVFGNDMEWSNRQIQRSFLNVRSKSFDAEHFRKSGLFHDNQ